MGEIQEQPTHAQRSPSMSLAALWQHEMKRIVITTTLLSFAVFGSIQAITYAAASKQITLVYNGEEIIAKTRQLQLKEFLEEQQITINVNDRISKERDALLRNGDIITIDHAIPVQLRMDGVTRTHYTIGKTVQAALRDLRIPLGEEDRIVPEPHTAIAEHSSIEVIRVQTLLEEHEQDIPFDLITLNDGNLDKGKLKLVQEGRSGRLLTTVKKVYENGHMISRDIVSEDVVQESMDEIVAVGARNPVTILSASSPDVQSISKDGLSFGVKEILEDVTLTAYDAGYNSTGKTEEHPHFGLTYSGTTVEEGRTVAVDPNVIPLGWWIYIEGVGLRKAEDIGSAIKGKKIDVYMDSEDQANRFGRKRGHTVYVVGPTKPTVE